MDIGKAILGMRTRQNHALEHATISILSKKQQGLRVAARSVEDGFFVYGRVDGALLEESAREGLRRLQEGERDLAVHAHCGTNLAVAGVLAGVASMFAFNRQRGVAGLPSAVLGATMAVMASQPVGRLVQRHITTSPNLDGVVIRGVRRFKLLNFEVLKVQTAVEKPVVSLVPSEA